VYDFAPVFSLPDPQEMAELKPDDIARIAHLARLALTDAEVPAYTLSMSRIMNLVGELQRVETSGVEPMSHSLPGAAARLRPDQVTETDHRAEYQRNAPQTEAGLYLVPRVIE
jgi:aspartyl-tRNA(Asn)/glutamyl-tRNA(Gln) amidotransferase subunit C